jgi:hypothetical protein
MLTTSIVIIIKKKEKMKKVLSYLGKFTMVFAFATLLMAAECDDNRPRNTSAKDEQAHTELNQQNLNKVQPSPRITWSLERDNLIKRFKLQNDRSVMFYMYIFNEGVSAPIGYYQVNKVSSVNSQLTNTEQIVRTEDHGGYSFTTLPSPAEDGSYGTNGDAVFGFTPEDIYIEHNMHYIVATVPLHFTQPVNKLAIVDVATQEQLKALMARLDAAK